MLDGDKLKPALREARRRAAPRMLEPSLAFTYFNMDDPVVGGYTPDKVALRRAIIMGYDATAEIKVLRNGQASPATQIVAARGPRPRPEALAAAEPYDPAAARALLDRFGYKDRDGDGFRELPDGKPLVVEKASTPDATDRARDELWKRSMDAIGIRIDVHQAEVAGPPEDGRGRQAADVGSAGSTRSPRAIRRLRAALQQEHRHVERRAAAAARVRQAVRSDAPAARRPRAHGAVREDDRPHERVRAWKVSPSRYSNWLVQPRVKGFKRHPFVQHRWEYYDVD